MSDLEFVNELLNESRKQCGRKVGIAYELENGEIIYVPE